MSCGGIRKRVSSVYKQENKAKKTGNRRDGVKVGSKQSSQVMHAVVSVAGTAWHVKSVMKREVGGMYRREIDV